MKHLPTLCAWLFATALFAAEPVTDKGPTFSGTFVSFQDGTLTLKGSSGELLRQQVSANFQAFQNNEHGPGVKQVGLNDALNRALPGTVFQINVATREIYFGLDHRVIGTFVSYQSGRLLLRAADAPPGFITKPAGMVSLAINPSVPVLQSINGGDYKPAGPAGQFLKTVKPGTLLTARSQYDPDRIEALQVGDPKRKIERYIGQTRGTVRGSFVAFKDGVLRIRGKGLTPLAANEYERVMNLRIADHVPVVESIDGEAYQPAGASVWKTLKEGTIVTVHKVEEVILEVQIGRARKN